MGLVFILMAGTGHSQQVSRQIDSITTNQQAGLGQQQNWETSKVWLTGVMLFVFVQLVVVVVVTFYITGRLKKRLKVIAARVDELTKETESSTTQRKIEDLREIVQLAMENNPLFLNRFNEFDPGFVKRIFHIAPNMVAVEIEMCILLRINFDTKEIARFTKSSVRSVEGKKRRIRKKLNIPSATDINVWMTNV
ncbi:hypothetical protein SAMN05216464_105282 [Mucilaginibacter pineti]|uniref:Regulatory protein, luxR family n=1 Tax=Mucilaginibacter pineti TaxID=1391627 RepID=A0A1G7C4G4_9SPHI|nr:hypothetical protein [Mucilaginibacter pineti]SDE34189.1 hypothetical protein SAMN05216464_105282 [Mucilaginibacter pineti]